MIPLALGNAISVLVGQSLRAGQPGNGRHISWTGIRLGLSIAVGISLVLWTNSERIAALYTSQNDVRVVAAHLIMLVGFYHLADAVQATAVNALRGYNKSGVPMLIYTTTLWGMGIGGGVILGLTDRLGPLEELPDSGLRQWPACGWWVCLSLFTLTE